MDIIIPFLHALRQKYQNSVSTLLIFNVISDVLTKFAIELTQRLCFFGINMTSYLCFDPGDQRQVTESL